MNCFNHHAVVAVGTCKACGKGLCQDCAVDLGHGISCRGDHEATVHSYNDVLKRNERILAAAPRNIFLAPMFFSFMGIVFIFWALSNPKGDQSFLISLGVGFIVFGWLMYRQGRKSFQGKNPS